MSFYEEALRRKFGIDISSLSSAAGNVVSKVNPSDVQSALSKAGSIGSAGDAASQGESLFNTASGLAGDNYAGVAAAAQAVVSTLPPSNVTTLLNDTLQVGEGAAAGVATGASIGGPIGAAVGGIIGGGAMIIKDAWPQLEADHFNLFKFAGQIVTATIELFTGTPAAPQVDFRYLSEKICFPAMQGPDHNSAVSPDGYWGVIPGLVNKNPRVQKNSSFYQTASGPDQDWSIMFTFLVSWPSPKNSTVASRAAGWALARYYTRKFSKRLGHTIASSANGGVEWSDVVKAFNGEEKRAATALSKIHTWYGNPDSFSTKLPFAWTGGTPVIQSNDPVSIRAIEKEFGTHPLDYLYFPISTKHDLSAKIFVPCAAKDVTDCWLTADTFLCLLCEGTYLGWSHAEAFHTALQMQYFWVKGRKADAKVFAQLSTNPHRNFSRVIGLTAAAMKRTKEGLSHPAPGVHGEGHPYRPATQRQAQEVQSIFLKRYTDNGSPAWFKSVGTSYENGEWFVVIYTRVPTEDIKSFVASLFDGNPPFYVNGVRVVIQSKGGVQFGSDSATNQTPPPVTTTEKPFMAKSSTALMAMCAALVGYALVKK